MKFLDEYDVIVVGGGMSGVVASIASARGGARTLLTEGSGLIGGLITGGRLTKPTGLIQPGVYQELVTRAAGYGGADATVQHSYWGSYTGVFDTEVMQRVVIETLDKFKVDVLMFANVTDVLQAGGSVSGVFVQTKEGTQLATSAVTIDASGDGDVAVLAGADHMIGRPGDGLVQPMTSYFRILGVDFPRLAEDCRRHSGDVSEIVLPDGAGEGNDPYILKFFMTGFGQRIQEARRQGFEWIIPRDTLTMKAGRLPGEINVNVTRCQGNALDARVRSHAALEVRRQAYCAFDFLQRYVPGFEHAVLLDVAPVLGVRETRRITGDYVLTEADVLGEARFPDAIGLCNAPVDIHEPGGVRATMTGVGSGYGIPYRCLLPAGVSGLLLAGRCISADHIAFGSTRNTPACALTAQAAGAAAAMAAARRLEPRAIPVADVQRALAAEGVVLGTEPADRLDQT